MAKVTVQSDEGYLQAVRAGKHGFISDLPAHEGGDDTGPEPYHLLLAALGTCVSMTLRMYANRKGWPLGTIRVELEHDRVPAADCDVGATRSGLIDRIQKRIYVTGPLDADQLQRLTYIAGRCPVNLTVQREIRMADSVELDSAAPQD